MTVALKILSSAKPSRGDLSKAYKELKPKGYKWADVLKKESRAKIVEELYKKPKAKPKAKAKVGKRDLDMMEMESMRMKQKADQMKIQAQQMEIDSVPKPKSKGGRPKKEKAPKE